PEQPERSRLNDFDDSPREDRINPAVRGKVQLPAIFLIVIAVLNLIAAIPCILTGLGLAATSPEALHMEMKKNPQQQQQIADMKKQFGWSVRDIYYGELFSFIGLGGFNLLSPIFTLLGGIQMLRLRGYGLAVFGAVMAALPCISCSACCG